VRRISAAGSYVVVVYQRRDIGRGHDSIRNAELGRERVAAERARLLNIDDRFLADGQRLLPFNPEVRSRHHEWADAISTSTDRTCPIKSRKPLRCCSGIFAGEIANHCVDDGLQLRRDFVLIRQSLQIHRRRVRFN
jgi:hypothetical protein